MTLKNQIRKLILEEEKTGISFAFVIDVKQYEQYWICIRFNFFFEPKPECNYIVEVLGIDNGKITLIEEKQFEEIENLVNFLEEKEVDPNYLRAMH